MGDGVNIAARLEGIAEPGAICLSEDAYRQVKRRLDLAVTDLGADAAQEHRRADPGLFAASRRARPGEACNRRRSRPSRNGVPSLAPLVAGIVALVVGRGRRLVFPRLDDRRARRRPRISPSSCCPSPTSPNDPAQDYFADGVTENLTTDLSRIRGSFVIARNTAFTFKGKGLDAKEIGKELDVRYVLEGSVQRDGTRVRVNAQLIDAQSGAHLWADRFEEDVADLFKLQDQVVARLANSLGNELVKAEARKGRPLAKPRRHRSRHARLGVAAAVAD